MTPPVRIAVVGAGLVGRRHAELVVRGRGCILSAVIDPDQSAAADIATATDAQVLCDISDLPDGSVDAAIVATPNDTHAGIAAACARRGLAILVEKPIAHNLQAAQDIIDVCAECDVPLLVGHHRRYHALVGEARALLESGKIGDLVAVSAIWAARKPNAYFSAGWRSRAGGGPILINLIHDIDLLQHLCGDIVSVSAMTGSAARHLAVEDTAAVVLRFASGVLCSISLSDAALSPWTFEAATGENPSIARTGEPVYRFMGTRGALEFPNLRLWRAVGGAEGDWSTSIAAEILDCRTTIPLEAQLAHFIKVVRGEAGPLVDGESARKNLAVVLAIQHSARTGKQADIA